jgi:peptidoglycan/LPS O-acetylase OafA/YrhL
MFVPIETLVFFVLWLALAMLGAGLLLRGWRWLLVSGWGWLLARVVGFVFGLALAIVGAGLLILGYEEGGKWWGHFLVLILCVVWTFALRRRDEEPDILISHEHKLRRFDSGPG